MDIGIHIMIGDAMEILEKEVVGVLLDPFLSRLEMDDIGKGLHGPDVFADGREQFRVLGGCRRGMSHLGSCRTLQFPSPLRNSKEKSICAPAYLLFMASSQSPRDLLVLCGRLLALQNVLVSTAGRRGVPSHP